MRVYAVIEEQRYSISDNPLILVATCAAKNLDNIVKDTYLDKQEAGVIVTSVIETVKAEIVRGNISQLNAKRLNQLSYAINFIRTISVWFSIHYYENDPLIGIRVQG